MRIHEQVTNLETSSELKLLFGQVINVLLQRCEVAGLDWQCPIGQAVC